MKQRKQRILHFDDINQCHAFMGFTGRTDLPDFHVYTIEETYPSTRKMMPPYTFRFYCITLHEDTQDGHLEINTHRFGKRNDSVAFQPPGHVSAWVRGEAERGFILYFQPEFLSHYPRALAEEFPFFRLTEISMLPLSLEVKDVLQTQLTELVQTFQRKHPYRVQMLQARLLAFLFDCKGVYEQYHREQEPISTTSTLAARFQQLVERHYLLHKSVQAYADMLHVTPNHLSQMVATQVGCQAHDLIAERVLMEAKKLLGYTDLSVAEIADYLGYEEPTHFTRLFKRYEAIAPLGFRRAAGAVLVP